MQEAVKFPRSPRTSEPRELPQDASRDAKENQALKITLDRPESIEAIKSAKPAPSKSDDESVPRPMAAQEVGAIPTGDGAGSHLRRRDDALSDNTADIARNESELADEAADVSTAQSTSTYEPINSAYFAGTFIMIVATIASLLVAAWSYAALQDVRGQLTSATSAKASAEQALAESQSRLTTAEKSLTDSQSRLAAAEKVVTSVRDALATAKTPIGVGGTAK